MPNEKTDQTWTEIRTKMLEAFAELEDSDFADTPPPHAELVAAIEAKTGRPPEEVEKVLRELAFGQFNEGIHARSPASGSGGVPRAG